jgi:hypothetical protein
VRAAALAALALLFTGCQTTQEKSARLEKAALHAQGHTGTQQLRSLRPSTHVKVLASTLLHGGTGYAAVVTLQNDSAQGLREVPIALEALDAHGTSVYSNRGPGLGNSLVNVSYLSPHGQALWVDDQVQTSGGVPASLHVQVGEAPAAASTSAPSLSVAGVRRFEEPSGGAGAGAEGTVTNRSTVEQRELVVYAVARKGGQIVAAGRAIVPQLAAGASSRFQAYLVGSPAGATLQASAPPTTLLSGGA